RSVLDHQTTVKVDKELLSLLAQAETPGDHQRLLRLLEPQVFSQPFLRMKTVPTPSCVPRTSDGCCAPARMLRGGPTVVQSRLRHSRRSRRMLRSPSQPHSQPAQPGL